MPVPVPVMAMVLLLSIMMQTRQSTIRLQGYRRHKSLQLTTRAWLLRLGLKQNMLPRMNSVVVQYTTVVRTVVRWTQRTQRSTMVVQCTGAGA